MAVDTKRLGHHISGWPEPLHRALEAESDLCASESVGSLLFMPVTTGDDTVTGIGGRAGLSGTAGEGMKILSSCFAGAPASCFSSLQLGLPGPR